jgi:16S rRNA (cytosine967-C5)-methyltransferase
MKHKIGKIQYTVRFVALEALLRIEKGGAYSNLLLRELMNQGRLNEKDGRLLTEMVYGTISRQLLLDYYLATFIKKAKKVDPWVKALLRLSLYQMLYLNKVPNHAILNEAVEIAKAKGNPGIGKFVNGVLRTIQREGVPALDQIKDPLERLATEISMPVWLTEKFVAQIGSEKTRELGLSLLEPSHASGRLDLQRITRNEAILQLQEEGIEARESQLSPYGIVADKGFLAGSSLYREGLLTIQDESSMLVAPALHIAPEHQVLDACAAPGGKTTHIASFLSAEAGGKVTALDIYPHKVNLITENAQRLAVSEVVQTEVMDAREVAQHFEAQQFDRILVDAPCSGLGLMRRKPDIKYNKQAADLQRLPEIQLAILESVAPTLKNSGIMIYSTCTIMVEENQAVVAAFLAAHPEFEQIDVTVNEQTATKISDQMLTIYPQDFMTDGFFISCLRKK